MAAVVLLDKLDATGDEYRWLRTQLETAGCSVISVDVGSLTDRSPADLRSSEVAARSGVDVGPLLEARDCGVVMDAMGRGAATISRWASSRRPGD